MLGSKKLQACIEAVIIIAVSGGGQPVNSKELCKLLGQKERYLEPIMQCLVHGNILRSIRGPKGGYVLMRERRKITLGEIASLVVMLDTKNTSLEDNVSWLHKQVITPLYEELDGFLLARLHQITLEEMCKQVESRKVFSKKSGEDFII